MREIHELLPGLFHWRTYHEGIGEDVYSAYVEATDPPVLIDPRMPIEGLDWFRKHNLPKHAYLTNRHHYRHSNQFEEAFGTKIWCQKDGLHEFTHGEQVQPFSSGDHLPGGVVALEVGVLCPEETAFHIPVADGVLAVGDAIIRINDDLDFVPDALMGDDPLAVKRGLRDVFRRHLEQRFDHLLFAHGEPWIGGGKAVLQRFIDSLTDL